MLCERNHGKLNWSKKRLNLSSLVRLLLEVLGLLSTP